MSGSLLILLCALAAALVVLFLAGPRVKVNENVGTPDLPDDLDDYLARSEAQYADIIPGAEKKIFWANLDKKRTKIAIVYLHGFSASRQETAPLFEHAAQKLGANLFSTRLAGHGRGSAAMGEARVNDWLIDTVEALEIGKRLGEKVIVAGCSTGVTLGTWLALREAAAGADGYVFISPNYGPADPKSELLTLPWAQQILPRVLGQEYRFEAESELHARYWTPRYPVGAIFQMMALVRMVRRCALERFNRPVFFIYSKLDTVTNIRETEKQIARIPAKNRRVLALTESVNKDNHVIAGDILAKHHTERLEQPILDFIQSVIL